MNHIVEIISWEEVKIFNSNFIGNSVQLKYKERHPSDTG